ncbi:hypothetical protein B5S33_g5102 [[Candida] boidinii]|nr:hypothetical protein B5S33_g5102 [[Candida] boidinii]
MTLKTSLITDRSFIVTIFLECITWFLQIPLVIIHWFGLEMWLESIIEQTFNKPDNVSSNFKFPFKRLSPSPSFTLQNSNSNENIELDNKINNSTSEFQNKIINAIDIVDIVHQHDYRVHEHVVQTRDGYLLSIHRILPKKVTASNVNLRQFNKPVVYMHHGLLTNSELFVLGDKTSKCLPFLLTDLGYDVWLGNNRGNKYSRKHIKYSSKDYKFWDFSLDEFAMFDIPDTIDYILNSTKEKNLNFIGFSQGSAQALAALSLSPSLNEKIKLFIGLSPAMIPKGLNHPIAKFFVNSAPNLLFNLFGKRAILPSVSFWEKLFGPNLYEKVVDNSLVLLFGWNGKNQTIIQKRVGYPHMFSPASVKCVVHWFQIINSKRFQMYDEGGSAGSRLVSLTNTCSQKNHRVAPFPTNTITTNTFLIYGLSDSLVDIDKSLENLSCPLEVLGIETYEHMDTLWANDVAEKVFSKVISKLAKFNDLQFPNELNKIPNQHIIRSNRLNSENPVFLDSIKETVTLDTSGLYASTSSISSHITSSLKYQNSSQVNTKDNDDHDHDDDNDNTDLFDDTFASSEQATSKFDHSISSLRKISSKYSLRKENDENDDKQDLLEVEDGNIDLMENLSILPDTKL